MKIVPESRLYQKGSYKSMLEQKSLLYHECFENCPRVPALLERVFRINARIEIPLYHEANQKLPQGHGPKRQCRDGNHLFMTNHMKIAQESRLYQNGFLKWMFEQKSPLYHECFENCPRVTALLDMAFRINARIEIPLLPYEANSKLPQSHDFVRKGL